LFKGFDVRDMLYQLKVAKGPVNRLYEEKEKIIEREIELLKSFLNEIKPHAAIEYINEQECVMIYEFQDSDNDLIGDEVFLSPDFEVVYQVYDEYAYKGFVPSAEVINGYAYNTLDFFMQHRSLEDIITFFLEQPEMFNRYKRRLEEENEERKSFLQSFEKIVSKK